MKKAALQRLALHLKIIELLRAHACQRQLHEALTCWRQLICPN